MPFREQNPLTAASGYPGQRIEWGPVLPAVGSVAGAVLDYVGQERANKANARQAQAQMDFQRQQTSTEYQRGVADMKAAGLNPALGYKQGGDSSGGGASSQQESSTRGTAEKLMAAINAYQTFANGAVQRDNIRAQTRLTEAQTNQATPLANLSLNHDYIDNFRDAVFARQNRDIFENRTWHEGFNAQLKNTFQTTSTAKSAEELNRTQATLNEQEMTNEWYRRHIAPYVNSTAKTLDLFQVVRPRFR